MRQSTGQEIERERRQSIAWLAMVAFHSCGLGADQSTVIAVFNSKSDHCATRESSQMSSVSSVQAAYNHYLARMLMCYFTGVCLCSLWVQAEDSLHT